MHGIRIIWRDRESWTPDNRRTASLSPVRSALSREALLVGSGKQDLAVRLSNLTQALISSLSTNLSGALKWPAYRLTCMGLLKQLGYLLRYLAVKKTGP